MDKKRSLEIKKDIYNAVPQEYHSALNDLYKPQDYEHYSPVKRLENRLGISGIYKKYKFPNDMKPEEYEALMEPMRIFEMLERGYNPENEKEEIVIDYLQSQKSKCLFEVRQMYNELAELNPEIKAAEIKPTQVRSYVAVISGVCSGFPVDDIVEFSQSTYKEKNDEINERRREQTRELEELSGIKIARGEKHLIENWCPSRRTYNEILKASGLADRKTRIKPRTTQKSTPIPVYDDGGFFAFQERRGFYND